MDQTKQIDLSILIPARNEEFLSRTIEDLLQNIRGNTEIVVVLDGYLPDPALNFQDERLTVIYHPEAVGQRKASNDAAKIAKGKYLMKVDAHCAFDEGFDVKMLDAIKGHDNWTMLPVMRNLYVFDWVCPNATPRKNMNGNDEPHRRYQGPSGPCKDCGMETVKELLWYAKPSPQSMAFRFDKTMHFQYWRNYVGQDDGDITDTMSIQGSCFMCTKERYFALGLSGEEFHSWGQQGVEVACKTWLSGGEVKVNHKTWYAHMFRTQGGDFSFPYENPMSKINENRELSRELFLRNKWPLAVHDFQWLLDKFNPPDWTQTKGMIYFTDSELDERIAKPVREQLKKVGQEKKMAITVSALKKVNDFGNKVIRFPSLKRGYLTMYKEILGALENSSDDIVFFTEHDVLYHPSHFDFIPPDKNTFYYNQNVWFLRASDGHAMHYDVNQVSGICVYKETAITHYKERIKMVEELEKTLGKDTHEFNKAIRNIGFEPFTHRRIKWNTKFDAKSWKSEFPNLDIKHGKNLTGQRWKKEEYRNQEGLINWQESDDFISGWPDSTKDLAKLFQ